MHQNCDLFAADVKNFLQRERKRNKVIAQKRLESHEKVEQEFAEQSETQDYEKLADTLRSFVWSEATIGGVLPGPSSNIDAMLNQKIPDVPAVNYMFKDTRKSLEKELEAVCLAEEKNQDTGRSTVVKGVQMMQEAISKSQQTVPSPLMQGYSYSKRDVRRRIVSEKVSVSFGVWNVLAALLGQA